MKLSKYSTRRPKDGAAYRPSDKPKTGNTAIVKPKVSKPKYLNEYDFLIFIDDTRSMAEVSLPNAKEWKVFRNYDDLNAWLDNVANVFGRREDTSFVTPATTFISFDHYLGATGRHSRFTGDDCIALCRMFKEDLGNHVDIQGHSSEPAMNDKKIKFWYGDEEEERSRDLL